MTFDDDDGLTVVIRHVPAIGICDSCGEAYFEEDTTRAVWPRSRHGRAAGSSPSTTRPEQLGYA